jgi:hypothetical protein
MMLIRVRGPVRENQRLGVADEESVPERAPHDNALVSRADLEVVVRVILADVQGGAQLEHILQEKPADGQPTVFSTVVNGMTNALIRDSKGLSAVGGCRQLEWRR